MSHVTHPDLLGNDPLTHCQLCSCTKVEKQHYGYHAEF